MSLRAYIEHEKLVAFLQAIGYSGIPSPKETFYAGGFKFYVSGDGVYVEPNESGFNAGYLKMNKDIKEMVTYFAYHDLLPIPKGVSREVGYYKYGKATAFLKENKWVDIVSTSADDLVKIFHDLCEGTIWPENYRCQKAQNPTATKRIKVLLREVKQIITDRIKAFFRRLFHKR